MCVRVCVHVCVCALGAGYILKSFYHVKAAREISEKKVRLQEMEHQHVDKMQQEVLMQQIAETEGAKRQIEHGDIDAQAKQLLDVHLHASHLLASKLLEEHASAQENLTAKVEARKQKRVEFAKAQKTRDIEEVQNSLKAIEDLHRREDGNVIIIITITTITTRCCRLGAR